MRAARVSYVECCEGKQRRSVGRRRGAASRTWSRAAKVWGATLLAEMRRRMPEDLRAEVRRLSLQIHRDDPPPQTARERQAAVVLRRIRQMGLDLPLSPCGVSVQ